MIELHLGDCMEFLPTLPDNSVFLQVCDPPYGIDYQSAWRTDKTQWKPKIANDKEPFLDWVKESYRVGKNGGALLCFCRWDIEDYFRSAIERAGYTMKSQIVWDKVIHGMGDLNGQFAPQHENIWFAAKGDFHFWNKRPTSVIRIRRVEPEKLVHPNEKPVPLYIRLIEFVCPPNENVGDWFFGSGASAKAAFMLERNYVGCDISDGYYEIAKRRIEAAQAQMLLPLPTEVVR